MSDTASQSGQSLYNSRELRLVSTAAATLLVAGWLLLALVDRYSGFLLLDLREWRITASSHAATPRADGLSFDELSRSLQPRQAARRPFRLTLQLPAHPEPGRYVAAEHVVRVDAEAAYCFEVFTWSPYLNPESAAALETFRVVASVNGEPVAALPIGDTDKARRISARAIRGEGGEIRLRLEVRSLVSRPRDSWRRASLTHFEYASLRRCPVS